MGIEPGYWMTGYPIGFAHLIGLARLAYAEEAPPPSISMTSRREDTPSFLSADSSREETVLVATPSR
jgi:hypothetical protein